ncbi:MAG: response regulator [Aggregatilineales bacterium]
MPTVLIVDDEENILHLCQMVLRRAGYNTLIASSGQEGLELTYSLMPDIIILDDMMPDLSGGEVCMQLKRDPLVRSIPVIMYSAGAKVRSSAYIKQIGADGVLYKPALPSEILEAVGMHLEARVG